MEGNPVSYLDPFGLEPWDTSFAHETLEFFINWFSYVSAIMAIGGILFAPASAVLCMLTTIMSIMSGLLACVNAALYVYDACNAESKEKCCKDIIYAITGVATGIWGMVSPISKICKYNYLVCEQAKNATDWLVGYLIDTFGKMAGY